MTVRKVDLEEFVNRRARLQRVRDAKFFGSWARAFSDGRVLIAKVPQIEREPGEVYSIQVFGDGSSLLVTAKLIADLGDTLAFEMQHPPKRIASTESARASMRGVMATIKVEEAVFDFDLADLSREGLGGIAPIELAKGTVVQFEVKGPPDLVTGTAVVRNCRATDHPGLFRIGLQVEVLDRTNRARWQAFFQGLAA